MKCSTASLDIVVCNSFKSRLVGLGKTHPILPRAAVWLVPCRCVHTFGMKQPLSLVFLDREHNIIGREVQAKPWRVFGMASAYSVIEMAQKSKEHLCSIEQEIARLGQTLAGVKNHHERRVKTRV